MSLPPPHRQPLKNDLHHHYPSGKVLGNVTSFRGTVKVVGQLDVRSVILHHYCAASARPSFLQAAASLLCPPEYQSL